MTERHEDRDGEQANGQRYSESDRHARPEGGKHEHGGQCSPTDQCIGDDERPEEVAVLAAESVATVRAHLLLGEAVVDPALSTVRTSALDRPMEQGCRAR